MHQTFYSDPLALALHSVFSPGAQVCAPAMPASPTWNERPTNIRWKS